MLRNDNKWIAELTGAAIAAAFALVQFVILQSSCFPKVPVKAQLAEIEPAVLAMNALILFSVILVLRLLAGKWSTALLISSVVMTIWAIANHYTALFHGGGLFPSELRSAGTAISVMGDYKYEIDDTVKRILKYGIPLTLISVLLVVLTRKVKRYTAFKSVVTAAELAVCTAGLGVLLFSPIQIKPLSTMEWRWSEGVRHYGFPACVIEDVEKTMHSLKKPEGYSAEEVEKYEVAGAAGTAQEYPDIILILNETFFNMDDYLKTGADADCMEDFYGLDNTIYGHAVVSCVGGGTNNSEFEYLMGDSMALLRNYAPCNYYDFSSNHDHYVQYLKDLGYSSAAFHCSLPSNYSRNKVYPLLGFDDIIIGSDKFKHRDFVYGGRKYTDSDNYKDMIDHYDAMPDGPRFMYMLTFQNHGGYEKNDDSLDVIHVSEDFGDLTDDMNEFLSTIYYSAKAFRELTEYYSKVDRPVIICMVGDHAPAFISELTNSEYSVEEEAIRAKAVPYAIWSNRKLETDGIYTDYTTIYQLMPMIQKMAGMPMTTYQKYSLDLHEKVPVVTSDGMVMDREGKIMPCTESPNREEIDKYFFMEYNSLKHGGDYREELFR